MGGLPDSERLFEVFWTEFSDRWNGYLTEKQWGRQRDIILKEREEHGIEGPLPLGFSSYEDYRETFYCSREMLQKVFDLLKKDWLSEKAVEAYFRPGAKEFRTKVGKQLKHLNVVRGPWLEFGLHKRLLDTIVESLLSSVTNVTITCQDTSKDGTDPEGSPKRPKQKRARPDLFTHREAIVQAAASSNPAMLGKGLDRFTCLELDGSRWREIPERWRREFGVTTWSEAYEDPRTRHLVKKMFSSYRGKR